jgi:hypothetical protein
MGFLVTLDQASNIASQRFEDGQGRLAFPVVVQEPGKDGKRLGEARISMDSGLLDFIRVLVDRLFVETEGFGDAPPGYTLS